MSEKPEVRIGLSVNLAPGVAATFVETARRKGCTITEAARRTIAVWKFVTDELAKGHRLVIVEGRGCRATEREVFVP